MSTQIIRDIAKQILSAKLFTVIIDEATDLSNTEQVVLVFRYVKEDLIEVEEFIGLYQTDAIDSQSLVRIIRDSLLRMNLKYSIAVGNAMMEPAICEVHEMV